MLDDITSGDGDIGDILGDLGVDLGKGSLEDLLGDVEAAAEEAGAAIEGALGEIFEEPSGGERRLDCVDEEEVSALQYVQVPYDFIENIAPLIALFILMEIFFGAIDSARNSFDNVKFRRLSAQFKFNAQFRYWIIFYYPAQIHILKAFRLIDVKSKDPTDQG